MMEKNNKSVEKRILLIALGSINNIGDEYLQETTKYICQQFVDVSLIEVAQLKPGRKHLVKSFGINWILGSLLVRFSTIFKNNISYKLKKKAFYIKYSSYFSSFIKGADKVILPVGMLKYATQDFSYVFWLINSLCTKYEKDVMMSAMSPQQANDSDWRYRQLVDAVNMPAVKMITTRDGQAGVDILKRDYLKRSIFCDYVGDPALWIPDVYKIKTEKAESEVAHVGINVIRRGIFEDYNRSLTDEELHKIYVDLICLIEQRGWRWSLFYNGMKSDWNVINELRTEIGFSEEHIIDGCLDGKMYAEMVSQFDVVFGARLHSCITSVAVGTPVVGFIWEDKIKYFSETMGISDFFFIPQNMTASKIINKMEEAMLYHFDYNNRDNYKQKTLDSISRYLLS